MENTRKVKIMENERKNVVKLLRVMADTAHSSADTYKDQDPEFATLMRRKATSYEETLWLLTDDKFFNDLWNIYFRKEGEN